jgi:hypothetical protein
MDICCKPPQQPGRMLQPLPETADRAYLVRNPSLAPAGPGDYDRPLASLLARAVKRLKEACNV